MKITNAVPFKTIRINYDPLKQRWWDKECHLEKLKLKEAKRESIKDKNNAEKFFKMRRNYRNLIDIKKEQLKIQEWKDKSGRKFWEMVNRQRKNREGISDRIDMTEWEEHFMKQMDGAKTEEENRKEQQEKHINTENENEIDLQEIRNAIVRMKKKKAAGGDKIPNEAWIYGEDEIIRDIYKTLSETWKGTQKLPMEWKTGIVTPVFKKGNKHEAENYKGITLMDTGYKIYAEILKNKLEQEMEEKETMKDTQIGYRKERGTIDAI